MTTASTGAVGESQGRLVRSASSVESVGRSQGRKTGEGAGAVRRSEANPTTACDSCGKGPFSSALPTTFWAPFLASTGPAAS
jgi:hypothetical protein